MSTPLTSNLQLYRLMDVGGGTMRMVSVANPAWHSVYDGEWVRWDHVRAALLPVTQPETRAEPDIHEGAVDRLESVFQMVDAIADESGETLKKYGYHPRTGLHQWERDCLNPPAGERACVPVYLSPLMDEDIARGEYQPAPHVAPAAVGSVATVPYAKGAECPAAAGITDSAVKSPAEGQS